MSARDILSNMAALHDEFRSFCKMDLFNDGDDARCAEKIEKLVLKGIDIDTVVDGRTALLWAAAFGKEKTFEACLELDANIHVKDSWGDTIAHMGAGQDTEILKTSIFYGADLNAQNNGNNTPLHLAVFLKRADNVKAILESGRVLDFSLKNKNNDTVFDIAFKNKNPVIMEMLKPFYQQEIKRKFGNPALTRDIKVPARIKIMIKKSTP